MLFIIKGLFVALAVVCLSTSVNLTAANDGPLKVFVLSGQSNMQGHAHTSTFEVNGLDPETKPMLDAMIDTDGEPVVLEDVRTCSKEPNSW